MIKLRFRTAPTLDHWRWPLKIVKMTLKYCQVFKMRKTGLPADHHQPPSTSFHFVRCDHEFPQYSGYRSTMRKIFFREIRLMCYALWITAFFYQGSFGRMMPLFTGLMTHQQSGPPARIVSFAIRGVLNPSGKFSILANQIIYDVSFFGACPLFRIYHRFGSVLR